MCSLAATLCFLLAVFGHDGRGDGTTATPTPTPTSRVAALHDTSRLIAGILDRECVANGSCHYVLFRCDCRPGPSGRHDRWRGFDFSSTIAGSRWIASVGAHSGAAVAIGAD